MAACGGSGEAEPRKRGHGRTLATSVYALIGARRAAKVHVENHMKSSFRKGKNMEIKNFILLLSFVTAFAAGEIILMQRNSLASPIVPERHSAQPRKDLPRIIFLSQSAVLIIKKIGRNTGSSEPG